MRFAVESQLASEMHNIVITIRVSVCIYISNNNMQRTLYHMKVLLAPFQFAWYSLTLISPQ